MCVCLQYSIQRRQQASRMRSHELLPQRGGGRCARCAVAESGGAEGEAVIEEERKFAFEAVLDISRFAFPVGKRLGIGGQRSGAKLACMHACMQYCDVYKHC